MWISLCAVLISMLLGSAPTGTGTGATPPPDDPGLDRIRVLRPAGGHPRTRPDHLCGGKAYSSRRNRRYLRRRQIRHTVPERRDQRANRQRRGSHGGRPTGPDRSRYARRNEVERAINALGGSRAVATRNDKRAYVFQGTVTLAAIRLWLRVRTCRTALSCRQVALAPPRPPPAGHRTGGRRVPRLGVPRTSPGPPSAGR